MAEAGRTVAEKEEQLSRWRQDWSTAIEGLRLGEDVGPTEANSILEAMQELHKKLSEAENLRERIDGIDKDADAFRQATVRLAALAAPDLVQTPTEQSASDLYDRLIAAQKADTRLNDLQEQSQREKDKRDKARMLSTQWQAALESMCREACRESPDQLIEAERLSARRQTLELENREVEDQLLRLAAGTPLDEFVEQAKHVDADRLSPAVQQLADEIDRLEQRTGRSPADDWPGTDRIAADGRQQSGCRSPSTSRESAGGNSQRRRAVRAITVGLDGAPADDGTLPPEESRAGARQRQPAVW